MSANARATSTLVLIKQARKQRDFCITPNEIYRDRRLDWSDIGMLLDLLHLRDGHQVSERWLAERRPSGESAVRSITHRLKALGYLQRIPERDGAGRIVRWVWQVSEFPQNGNAATGSGRDRSGQEKGNPLCGDPPCGFPTRGKPPAKKLRTQEDLRTTTTDLVFPPVLAGREDVVVRWMNGFNQGQCQAFLDELAQAMKRKRTLPPENPEGWLRSIIRSAREQPFVPELAHREAASRAEKITRSAREECEAAAQAEADRSTTAESAAAWALLERLSDGDVRELGRRVRDFLPAAAVERWIAAGRPMAGPVPAVLAAKAADDERR